MAHSESHSFFQADTTSSSNNSNITTTTSQQSQPVKKTSPHSKGEGERRGSGRGKWAEETPAAASCLKIVYRGRFLDEWKTLESNKIPCGQPTIAHLTIKDVMQLDNDDPKSSDNAPKCQCMIL
ncbi:6791_t:CDS:2 [Diversispora eburnea]|uniref:6791_t:CDS:1 n=1 Tax=Diversispora eburnea TaxID=1213867 RepID=A0A9N9A475_9GLOM|nr:6791_t:CDS:2 [Diversispora eburnea]